MDVFEKAEKFYDRNSSKATKKHQYNIFRSIVKGVTIHGKCTNLS